MEKNKNWLDDMIDEEYRKIRMEQLEQYDFITKLGGNDVKKEDDKFWGDMWDNICKYN